MPGSSTSGRQQAKRFAALERRRAEFERRLAGILREWADAEDDDGARKQLLRRAEHHEEAAGHHERAAKFQDEAADRMDH